MIKFIIIIYVKEKHYCLEKSHNLANFQKGGRQTELVPVHVYAHMLHCLLDNTLFSLIGPLRAVGP